MFSKKNGALSSAYDCAICWMSIKWDDCRQTGTQRHVSKILWPSGHTINPRPRCLSIIMCTKYGDIRVFLFFDLWCGNTQFHIQSLTGRRLTPLYPRPTPCHKHAKTLYTIHRAVRKYGKNIRRNHAQHQGLFSAETALWSQKKFI